MSSRWRSPPGGRLVGGVPLDAFGWRLLLLPVAILILVAAFAGIPGAQGWPVHAGPGGAVGRALLITASDMLGSEAQGWPAVFIALGVGIVFLLPVLGLTLREWRWIGALLFWPFRFPFRRRARTESRVERPLRAEPDFAQADDRDISPAAEIAARPLASKIKRERAKSGVAEGSDRKRGKREPETGQAPDRGTKKATAAARAAKRAGARAKPFLKKRAKLIADKYPTA